MALKENGKGDLIAVVHGRIRYLLIFASFQLVNATLSMRNLHCCMSKPCPPLSIEDQSRESDVGMATNTDRLHLFDFFGFFLIVYLKFF
jgi:hypothetical protein